MNVRRAATLSGFNGVEKELNQTVFVGGGRHVASGS